MVKIIMHGFQHLLGTADLKKNVLLKIIETANSFISPDGKGFRSSTLLKNKTVVNLFLEASTRTRSSFEIAANHLGAHVINFDTANSSISKGETFFDTFKTLEAMHSDIFVVRHPEPRILRLLTQYARPHTHIINAGDGCHEHPTQAILDALTIIQHKPSFSKLRIAIVGDILHSRVARSQIHAFTTLNAAEVRVVAPQALLPSDIEKFNVKVHHSLASGLADVDVITVLRLQRERDYINILPEENEFHSEYGITIRSLNYAKSDVIVMHPGPINRGVEIDSDVADGTHSVILKQVTNGVAVRMAVMSLLGKI